MSQGSLFKPEEMAPKPKTDWRPPQSFPRLEGAKALSLDVETFDPGLAAGRGPDYKNGFVCGLSVGTDDGHNWYFPVRHEAGGNMDPAKVFAWAKEELGRVTQPKIGANLGYDIGFLKEEGVDVAGRLMDVQMAEPLLDEHSGRYNLGAIASRYGLGGKADDELYKWGAAAFGGKPTRKAQAGNIWRMPPAVVGPYAESDARLPMQLMALQMKELRKQGLEDLFDLEMDLVPMIAAMYKRGVRVDVEAAEKLAKELGGRRKAALQRLEELAGRPINPDASSDLVLLFRKLGLPVINTVKGNPSFSKEVLSGIDHEATTLVTEARRWEKFKGTFMDGYIKKHGSTGRIHAKFHQLRTDENGTISGRFSSSGPNLQNIPARDKELARLVRAMFLPEPGEYWAKHDYSQIEYRFLVHYAMGKGAEKVREEYRKNPKTDYHAMAAEWTGLRRKIAKNWNFGVVYGMGIDTMAKKFGMSKAEAKRQFNAYHERMPFVRELMTAASDAAMRRGYIKTIMGRRCRFPYWEPADGTLGFETPIKGRRAAADRWPGRRLTRAFGYTAVNKLLQGSAADMIKAAMRKIWNSGICDVLGAPLLTVHDEKDWSVPETKEGKEALTEARELMTSAIPLKIPIMVDEEVGPDWGNVK